jgi:hypothetical protein
VEAGGYPASTTDRVSTKIRMRELEFFYVNQRSLKSIDFHEKHISAIIRHPQNPKNVKSKKRTKQCSRVL